MIDATPPTRLPLSKQPALHAPAPLGGFEHFVAARAKPQFISPVAQQLLGTSEEHAPRRQGSPRAAVSISEISGRAIADLGAAPAAPPPTLEPPPPSDRPRPESPAGSRPQSKTDNPAPAQRFDRPTATAASTRPSPAELSHIQAARQPTAAPDQARAVGPAPRSGTTAPATTAAPAGSPSTSPRGEHSGQSSARQDPAPAARALLATNRSFRLESSAPASASRPGAPHDTEQQTRFAAQLSRGLASILRQGGGTLTMRLQPEALGHLTINMDLNPGRVGATFTVADSQARDLLSDNLSLLRSALEARGLDVQRLEILVAQPAEPGEPQPDSSDEDGNAGGAGAQGRDAHPRRDAHDTTAHGGAASSEQSPSDECERMQEASAVMPAALRLWSRHVEAGGAHMLTIRLDAIA